jgi:hypothetical protein
VISDLTDACQSSRSSAIWLMLYRQPASGRRLGFIQVRDLRE